MTDVFGRRRDEEGSFRSSLSMSTRLAAAVITVAIVSLLVAMVVGLRTGSDLATDIYQDRILALRASARLDVNAQIGFYERTARGLAESPQAAVAIERLDDGIDELDDDGPPPQDDTVAIYEAYGSAYLDPQRAAGNAIDYRDIISPRPAAQRLQFAYGVDTGVVEEPEDIDDAGDGSAWSAAHAAVHPMYREVTNRLDLVDLFLVSPDLDVVYSVRKGPELGTSLAVGPFSGSVLADAASEVMTNPGEGTAMSDLSFTPTQLAPAGVIAAPVLAGDDVAGALVLMYDSDPFTAVLTADGEWAEAGYPASSDTYLVGEDGTTRSEPRGFLEDPVAFLDELEARGELTEEQRASIAARDTTVLTLRAPDELLRAEDDGDRSVVAHTGFTSADTLGTITPLDRSVGWSIAAGMSSEEAHADLDDFRQVFAVGVAIFVALLAFAAVWWANRVVRPVRRISERLASRALEADHTVEPSPHPPGIDIPERSPIEFHQLANSFESMAGTLRAQRTEVLDARAERLRLLREMLPPTVAQRVSEGQLRSLDDVPSVTVGVATVEGLAGLVRPESSINGHRLVERLHAELDQTALAHGVERIKIVGDAYYAACGHDRPYLDHAPRLAAFAADARDAVRSIGAETGEELDLSVGVHTGPVTVGMTGGQRLVYDVWGPTVTIAHNLARVATPGQILVSAETRALLPADLEMSRFTMSADDDGDRALELSPGGVWIVDDASALTDGVTT